MVDGGVGKSGYKKSRIRETKNLSTDADSRTNTIFKRLHDLSRRKKKKKTNGAVDASTRWLHAWAMDALHPPPVFRAPRVGDGRSAPTPRF